MVGTGNCRSGSQIGHLRPRPAGIRLVLARRAAPVALAEPGRHAARVVNKLSVWFYDKDIVRLAMRPEA